MKKNILIIFTLILLLGLSIDVFASINVEKRSRNDLKIHDSIEVTSDNLDNILNTPKVNEKEKIYDFADLFTDQEEVNIYNQIMAFIEVSNYDLAVVTINDNNKRDEEEYADDFYDYNYFGFDDSFSGLLILIDMDNRGIYISTTGFAIKMYDDYRINQIIDYGWDNLVSGLYNDCINDTINRLNYYYNLGYPSSNDDLVIDGTDVYYNKEYGISDYIQTSLMIAVVGTVIIVIILYFKTRLKIKAASTVSYLVNEEDVNINKHFLRSHVTRTLRSSDSGGSSFGGSSHHSSSSGRSHGGGGRRF